MSDFSKAEMIWWMYLFQILTIWVIFPSSTLSHMFSFFTSSVRSIFVLLSIRTPFLGIANTTTFFSSTRLTQLFIYLLLHMDDFLFHLAFGSLLLINLSSGLFVLYHLTEASFTFVLVMLRSSCNRVSLSAKECSRWKQIVTSLFYYQRAVRLHSMESTYCLVVRPNQVIIESPCTGSGL